MPGWRRLLKHRTVVNLKAGGAFRGVLWKRARDFVVLRKAEFIPEGLENGTPMDGDVIVERREVSFYQFPHGAGY